MHSFEKNVCPTLVLITFFHISQAGILMAASLCNLFSPHLCYKDPLITPPLCNVTVPQFCYADLTPPVFQDRAEKLAYQGQAKLRDLGYQHHPKILVPQ